jgi:hypothetical protein
MTNRSKKTIHGIARCLGPVSLASLNHTVLGASFIFRERRVRVLCPMGIETKRYQGQIVYGAAKAARGEPR